MPLFFNSRIWRHWHSNLEIGRMRFSRLLHALLFFVQGRQIVGKSRLGDGYRTLYFVVHFISKRHYATRSNWRNSVLFGYVLAYLFSESERYVVGILFFNVPLFYSSRLEFSDETRSMDGRSRSNILFVRRRIRRSFSIRKLQQIWKRLLSRLSSYLSRQFIHQFLFWICHFLLPWVHVSLPKQTHWRSRWSRPRPCFWSVSRGYCNLTRISNMVLSVLHHNDYAWDGQCCKNFLTFS